MHDQQVDQEPRTRANAGSRADRLARWVLVIVLLAIGVVAIGFVPEGRDALTGVTASARADFIPLNFASAALLVALIVALKLLRAPDRSSAAVVFTTAVGLMLVVGLGVAPLQNAWESHATQRPIERRLEDRSALDPNGPISGIWPFYSTLGEIATDGVIVPAAESGIYATEVSEIPVTVETYDYRIAADDQRMRGEWLLDLVVDGDQHIILIGRGTRYRWYESGVSTFFIAEPT